MSELQTVRELDTVRELARAAAASLEANRQRIDDLNVYPVPDGDTGTNLTLTVRSVLESLDSLAESDRPTLAHQIARAALMGARGNSGVILSQIVRGVADVLGEDGRIDAPVLAAALRSASDAAYRAVRRPVEGTMLTVIRELAEEGERVARPELPVSELLAALVRRGEDALARTPEYLDVLRDAGVVDAGGAGLLELVRGLYAGVAGEALPEPPPREELGFEAVHRELSRYRYCTVFVVEGTELDVDWLEEELDRLGDSLLVVGDRSALKVHVHTDDPGAALGLGTAVGAIEGVEIANMHRQTVEREGRLLEAVPDLPVDTNTTDVVAVVAGAGNRRLYESLGAARIVEGGQSMNPSTAEIVEAIESTAAPEVLVLPNNPNVILSAEQAARLAEKPVQVIHSDSIQAGLAAMVAYDGTRSAGENAEAMREALAAVATGAVTVASRDVELNGLSIRKGAYLGLHQGVPVAGGPTFDEVATAVVEQLLSEPREVLTLLTGEDDPQLDALVARLAERHPELELEIQAGGQPHYLLLLVAE